MNLPAPPPSGRWRDLARRSASAAILAPAALLCLWLGGPAWLALAGLATLGLAWEWARMFRLPAYAAATMTAGVAVVVALLLRGAAAPQMVGAWFSLVVIHMLWFRRRAATLGMLVIAPPAVALAGLRLGPEGFYNILFLLLIVWSSDIGAYLVGRLVGGPRLALSISPGKTWSGAAGGLIAAALVGYAGASLLAPPAGLHALALALLLGIVAQLGDLAESALKRHCGVKDSGHLIPGHGGVFDRLDGLLAAATAMGVLAVATGQAGVLWR